MRCRSKLGLSIASILLSSCRRSGILDPHGPVAAAEKLILLDATAIMLVVAVPVILMTFAIPWWYRASNKRAAYNPNWSYSGQIELVVWAIPAMVVILLGGVEWIGSHELDPARKLESKLAPVRVEVISMNWKWLFIYPDLNVASLNVLVVPAGAPLELALTSATVMSAFFVPQIGSQIYAMPGMTTHLNLMADAGSFPGMSSMYTGDGFSDMKFIMHAVGAAQFATWVERARGAKALDASAYAELLRPEVVTEPQIFSMVEPGMYEHILRLAAPPAAKSVKDK